MTPDPPISAESPHLQAGGRGFDSLQLHEEESLRLHRFFFTFWDKGDGAASPLGICKDLGEWGNPEVAASLFEGSADTKDHRLVEGPAENLQTGRQSDRGRT
ncbi:MAG: hypothetical protein ACI9TF_000778 [Paracrocinitomix sp.]|jgi:hypothetical protein